MSLIGRLAPPDPCLLPDFGHAFYCKEKEKQEKGSSLALAYVKARLDTFARWYKF